MSENRLREAPGLPDLSPGQELALLARTIHREGYDDHLAQAHHRCVVLAWCCGQAWRARAAGGGVPLKPDQYEETAGYFHHIACPGLWEAMVRRELRADPTVLDETPTPDRAPSSP